jgi:hypothetical protein
MAQMTISPVGGSGFQPPVQSPLAAVKAEAAEIKGAPDHDGDSDDTAAGAAKSVNVKA